jgi:large subunit ribosomal protein L30e
VELSKKIAQAIATGKVVIGTERSLKALKQGRAKLVIVAANCALEALEDAKYYASLGGAELRVYDGDSTSLGLACGKPFSVDMLAVLDPGNSNILSAEGRR